MSVASILKLAVLIHLEISHQESNNSNSSIYFSIIRQPEKLTIFCRVCEQRGSRYFFLNLFLLCGVKPHTNLQKFLSSSQQGFLNIIIIFMFHTLERLYTRFIIINIILVSSNILRINKCLFQHDGDTRQGSISQFDIQLQYM